MVSEIIIVRLINYYAVRFVDDTSPRVREKLLNTVKYRLETIRNLHTSQLNIISQTNRKLVVTLVSTKETQKKYKYDDTK